jgi:AcrR family transcriptional regulator
MTELSRANDVLPTAEIETRRSSVDRILEAARDCLGESGFAAFSTRAVAERAEVPLSQIHYHFRSKQQLLLRVLEQENEALVSRQRAMFEGPGSFAGKWDRACDYLESDIGSGYVRRLHELFGLAYADPVVAAELRTMVRGWHTAIADLVRRSLRPETLARVGLSPEAFAALAGSAFLGAESAILIGMGESQAPNRQGLRQVGRWIAVLEARQASAVQDERVSRRRPAVDGGSDAGP